MAWNPLGSVFREGSEQSVRLKTLLGTLERKYGVSGDVILLAWILKHPAKILNGRRYYHTEAFRNDERRFPHYHEAQRWLERVARLQRTARPRAA